MKIVVAMFMVCLSILSGKVFADGRTFNYNVTFSTVTGEVSGLTVIDNDLFGILKSRPVQLEFAKEFALSGPKMRVKGNLADPNDYSLTLVAEKCMFSPCEEMVVGELSREGIAWEGKVVTRNFRVTGDVSKITYYMNLKNEVTSCKRKYFITTVTHDLSWETSVAFSIPGENFKYYGQKDTKRIEKHFARSCSHYLKE